MGWWGHSNPTLCKRICLNFLNSLAAGLQELQAQALMPLFMPKKPGETSLNIFYIFCEHLSVMCKGRNTSANNHVIWVLGASDFK